MGRGDKRSFKGKVFKGSFGKTRPRHLQKKAAAATAPAPAQPQAKRK
ncbi:MAG TPA: 30S ribosomal protein THX [Usitatibacter sp.]|nr:30S ribosomal protein THX [Usitatibacter sp.]